MYRGSGIDWKQHLQKYGNDVTTIILLQTTDKQELIAVGRYYSTLWNVVQAVDDFGNKIYANRIPESGGGPGQAIGHTKNQAWKERISNALKNSPLSRRNNQRGKNNHMYGVIREMHHRFGIKHTTRSKELISKNHHDVSGANNPKARVVSITTTDGKTYTSHGTLAPLCKELGLSINSVYIMLSLGRTQFTRGKFKGYKVCYID